MKRNKPQSSQQSILTSYFSKPTLKVNEDKNYCSQRSVDSAFSSQTSPDKCLVTSNKTLKKNSKKAKNVPKSVSQPKLSVRSPNKNSISKVIKSPTNNKKESKFMESPKKSLSSDISKWLSPTKKQPTLEEKDFSDQPTNLSHFNNLSEVIDLTDESSFTQPKENIILRRSPRKHSSTPEKMKYISPLKEIETLPETADNNLHDETDSSTNNKKESQLMESPKKSLSLGISKWLSPTKKQPTIEEKDFSDKPPNLSHFNNLSKVLDLTDESSFTQPKENIILRRSPRKHSRTPEKMKYISPLKEIETLPETVGNNLLDETDDVFFAIYASPQKCNKNELNKRTREEGSPGGDKKRIRSWNLSPVKISKKINSGNDTSALLKKLDPNNVVDLSQGSRCKVTDVIPADQDLLLTLMCLLTNAHTLCTLQYPWCGLLVSVGDLVSVKASKCNESQGGWYVSDRGGHWFILHSDMLISCTTVVGSLFCKRRSVLSQFFKEISSDSQSTAMCVGNIVHQLLQQTMKLKLNNEEEIKKLFDEVLCGQDLVRTAYLQGMSLDKIKETTLHYLPKIVEFIRDYVSIGKKTMDSTGKDWPGKITEIRDIEENVWIPQFGLKGKIDATVQVKVHSKSKIMPLELKTGKPSNSAEHRGQVILYCLMLSQLGKDTVDSGLLLYLKDNVLKEVKGGEVERRDLLMLRNEMASRLQAAYDSSQHHETISLPEPIDWKSVCLSCSQLIPCTASLRKSGDMSHPLSAIVPETTSHLSDKHLEYIFKWLRLISLEMKESKQFSPIWANSIHIREEEGNCISDLKITGNITTKQFKVEITFTRDRPLKEGVVEEGQYVVVSSDTQVAIACGHVQSISLSHVTLLLDRDLSKFQPPFHIDRYEAGKSSNFMTTFLSVLLENSHKTSNLRRLIIDKELPKFAGKLSSKIKVKCREVFSDINRDQVRALLQVLSAESFIIIKGMPGTGKSRTVGALIEIMILLGHSVLLTSHTHSAVDNILMRLPKSLHNKILRLGSAKRVHPSVAHLTESSLLASLPNMSSDQLAAFYNDKSIVGVTCLGALHQLLSRKEFDYCIIDEATQVCQPEALAALSASKKFVLIGDPNQLPPLVISDKAKELGMGVSLLEHLDRPAVTSILTVQYRMNEVITSLANAFTYNNLLKCANHVVATSTIKISKKLDEDTPEWLKKLCSSDLSDSILVINVSVSNQSSHNVNDTEAKIVQTAVSTLMKVGVQDIDIGVMSPYRAQVSLIESLLKGISGAIEVSTVDQYQGRDKAVIFYSATRNKPMVAGTNDILGDKNRLTVAITRAKYKLVILGNVETLSSYPTFNSLFSHIEKCQIVNFTSNEIT